MYYILHTQLSVALLNKIPPLIFYAEGMKMRTSKQESNGNPKTNKAVSSLLVFF